MRLESVKAEILQIESEMQKLPMDATSWREKAVPAIKTELQPIVDRLGRELLREKDSRVIKQIFELHNLTNRVMVKMLEVRINHLSNLLMAVSTSVAVSAGVDEPVSEGVHAKWVCLL